jgi:TP901 family phage tail tape measure protein
MAGQVNIGVNLDFTAQNLAQIQKQLSSTLDAIEQNGVKLGLSPETISQMKAEVSKLSESIVKNFNNTTGKINFDKVRVDLENAGVSAAGLGAKLQTVGVNGQSAFNSITKSAYTFEAKIKNTESLLYKFSQTLNNTIKWNISSSIVNQFSGEIQRAVYFTKDLDKSLNNIRIVSGASKDEMANFAIEANNAAKALKTSTVEYSDAALVYFQQGLAADDVKKMTEATVMGANIAGESTEEMSNLLTSTMNGYKMSADEALDVTDKLSAVGATTAADFYELATGMSKVASMANAAGIDIDKLNAQLATIVSVTKEAPESVGTSLKTIYGRMLAFQNNATDLMEDDDGELFGAPSVESALEKFSKATNTEISLFETTKDGTKVMRNLGTVIDEIGDAWQKTDNQAVKFGLSTALAGSRQQNRLVALFDSWDDYKEAVTTSLNAEGTTLKQNEVYMDSYAAHAKNLQASMESLYMELFNSDDMIGIVDAINEIVKGLTTIVDLLGGLPGVLGVISGLMTKTVFSKQLSGLASNLANKKIAEKFQGADSAGVRQDGRNSSDYRKDETKYKDKLQTVSTVFKGEDFESVRKMTEELLKQKKQIEEVRASANLLNEAYKRTNSAITNSSASKGVFKSLQADAEGNVIATDRLNKKLQEFKTTYSANLTDTAAEELQDLEYNLNNSDIKLQDFIGQFKALISTMANAKAQNDLGLDTNFDELTQQLNQLEVGYEQNAQVLNETLDPMTEYANKINNIRNGISGAIPVLTTLFSALGDDSKSAGEKALSVLTALGTALTFQMDTIIATTTAKMSEIAVTDLQTASEQGGIAAKLASAAAEASGTKATILSTAAKVAATVANGGLTASFYALASGIWAALAPILPFVAAIGGIVAVGYGVVKLFDALVVTEKELQEQSQEANDALTEVQNTISDLESNLKSLNDQINELDPITDADEIADLERQVSLTEAQLAAEKELEKVRAKEANQAQYDYLKEAYDTPDNSIYNSETGGYDYKTDQEVYKDKINERQSIGKELKDKFDIQDISEIDQVIATKKADLEKAIADGDGKLKKSLKEDIKELENYSDRYETLTNELAEETNNILSEVGKVDLSQLDKNNEADKQIIKFIDSLKATAEQGLLELNPSDFIERLFDESDLTSIMDKLSSGGDISDILSKYEDTFSALGITTEEMTDYLQDYADAMQESGTVVDDAQSQYDRLVNNINLLSKSYQDGETNLDDYTSGVYKNLEGLAQLADKTGEIKGDFSGTVNEFVGDLGEALGSLNDQYNSGALSIDDYIESAKNQVKQLLELKEVFPEIGDEIDALLNKNFDMDGITGLLDMDELVDGWSNTQDVISQVTAEFENLASVQELVADGFKISAEAASELADMYPQLLENAQTTADGQILLDEEVYNNFINSRQGMLAADIDSQIAQLEAKKAALEAAKAQAQAELELANAVASGEVDIENAKAQMLSTAEQNLTQYLIDLGVSEVDAQRAAAEAKAGNIQEYNRIVGDVADDTANNLANAMVAAANATRSNVQGMVSSLDALGKQSASVATQIGNMGSGKTTYSGPVAVGGGSAGGASFSASTSSGNFKGVTATAIKAAAPEMQSWTDRLNMDLSGYTQGIAQINAQISVLQGLKNRNANKNYNKNGGSGGKGGKGGKGGGGGGSGSDTEEYIVELDKLKKAMQALADVQQEIEKNDTELDAAETSQEKYDLLGKKIELYDKERVALHNLADARRAVIKTNVEELRSKGFKVDYDPKNHKLEIKNEEHINQLKGKDTEATNELRKEMEKLISTTEDLNDANKDTSQSWWENYYEQKDLLKERLDTEIEMYKEQLENERRIRNVSVQDIKDSYNDMINALKKAYNTGVITSEEFWDKLVEIGKDKMSAIRQDIENTIEHAKLIGRMSPEQEAAQWVAYRGQVNEMMALGQIGDYDDYISELEDIYEKIDSSLKEVYNNSIKNQQHAINMLAKTAGTEEKQIAIYRNMMEETYNEAQRLRAKNYEANKETIQELEEQWYSYYESILEIQKQMKESTVSAVVSVIDDRIEELEEQKEALSTLGELDNMLVDLKSELLSADEDDKALIQEKIDYLEEQRDIYASLTDAEEKRLKMQEIEKALADITLKQLERKVELAKNNLVQRVWYEDKGWVWEADQSAISEAEKELNDFKNEMDQTDIDNEIDRLEKYKEKWENIADDYETEQNKLIALQELGADWEAKILDQRLDVLETFKDGYIDVLDQLNSGMQFPEYTVEKGSDDIFGGNTGHVYDLEAKYYGYDGKGYNASIDYSQAIMDAKKRNASEEEILELKRVRNLKIKGEKMTQYYDALDDFTEREKELLAQQSANVAENATSTGTSIASTIQNLQALDNQWTSTLDLTDPLKTYQTQLDELYEAEQKNYKDRLEAAEKFVKEYNATMAKMASTASGGIQISGGTSTGGSGGKKTSSGGKVGATIGAAIGSVGGVIGSTIGGIIGGVIGSATNKKGSTSKKTSSSTKKKKYASGGVNDYTGDAALHGTPNHVETVFNAEDGKKLYDLVHNTKDLADTIAEDMVPYIPSLFENIGEIGFNPRNMMMPTIPKVEPQTIENDESTTFSNCKFEIKTDANNFEALVNDMEVKIKNR